MEPQSAAKLEHLEQFHHLIYLSIYPIYSFILSLCAIIADILRPHIRFATASMVTDDGARCAVVLSSPGSCQGKSNAKAAKDARGG